MRLQRRNPRPPGKHTARLAVAATFAATAVAVVGAPLPAAAAVAPLVATQSGKCLDVVGGISDPGAPLQIWGCSGAAWQQWELTGAGELRTLGGTRCLDAEGWGTASGTRLITWTCTGAVNQQFTRGAGGTLVGRHSGLCVDVKDGATAHGTPVRLWTCNGAPAQQWQFGTPSAPAPAGSLVVAADGTGRYRTVQQAVDAVPVDSPSRVVIAVRPGTYRGALTVPSNKPNITLLGLGDSPDDVVIVDDRAAGTPKPGGGTYGTGGSATATVSGRDFHADNLTIANDFDEAANAGLPGHQAVALSLGSDRAVLDDVHLLGNQDTLYVADSARAYFSDCYIAGDVDYVFGGGTAVFDRCELRQLVRGGYTTAASTPTTRRYGFLFHRSRFTGTAPAASTHLGRPWRQGAQVVVRESALGAHIKGAQPWTDMGTATWQNARFREFRNTGPGAGTGPNRPQLSDAEAAGYTPQRYLAGGDGWNPVSTGWPSTPDGFAAVAGLGLSGTTGGQGGPTVTVTDQASLERYAAAATPYVIRVAGRITVQPFGKEIPVASDKTIIGVGTTGEIFQGGLQLKDVRNVVIRNLTIGNTYDPNDPDGKCCDHDAIQMDGAHHVWIDHNRLTRAGDGLLDSRLDTSFVTVSYNELSNHNKAFGIGWTSNVTAQLTIHHNWIRSTNQRNPSVDNVARAHLYNNLLQDVTSYGIRARGGTRAVVENNHFLRVANPYSYQDTAELVQRGNVVASSTGSQTSRGTAFDPRASYSYALDAASDLPNLLATRTGPQADIR
ncbi:pectin methylesterase-like acyl-CoA thioesterase [Kineococcus xinjiangensis]|uniref:Pectin methylesterase-like acyl-CoA thioesterase n=1 Tax=Kineococcus xinjiangensis TaxID=512762 RepID=A0A2S6IDN3_9ACTN|nr:pectinesterase family protein [Kineococcus xinjiangensis]PPK92321.1 pectin methylesterase-like acyl-CoA thioesterase [Kineococcus xinjiangensis]